jgi:hypothetical protein
LIKNIDRKTQQKGDIAMTLFIFSLISMIVFSVLLLLQYICNIDVDNIDLGSFEKDLRFFWNYSFTK